VLKVGSDCRHVKPEELGENFRRIHDGAVLNGRQATRLRLRKLPTSSCVKISKRQNGFLDKRLNARRAETRRAHVGQGAQQLPAERDDCSVEMSTLRST